MSVKRLVLDVLVPLEPDALTFATRISEIENIDGIAISVLEQDEQTKTVVMTIEGEAVPYQAVREAVRELGGSVHSVDEIIVGARMVEPRLVRPER